jgi:hypothetical protein
MVTQANWEDDVIWNGDDIKHKVLQKLNNKSNAAGKFYYTSHISQFEFEIHVYSHPCIFEILAPFSKENR